MSKSTYYLTTPIYYVNDRPHIGHAYTSLAADVLARFYRLENCRVRFLTGTDEHGQKIVKAAQEAGEGELAFCDRMSAEFKRMSRYMNFSNDLFLRTTDEQHKRRVRQVWQKLLAQGDIYLGQYAGWYAISEECFYNEKELITDSQGNKLSPLGSHVEWLEQESYFFRLSKWQEQLLELYEKKPNLVKPTSRHNETVSFIAGGLSDISISRSNVTWGIPVPNDDRHRIYVWFDALLSYLTAVGYPNDLQPFWPPNVQLLGKDILRFHSVYWPALLLALELPVPERIFAHGWWTIEGKKMSKSLGNIIKPQDLVKTYGVDQVRYYLLRDFAFGNDGDFSHEKLKKCVNGELANSLGNLVHRVTSMVHRYAGGKVPEKGDVQVQDEEALRDVHVFLNPMRAYMQEQDFFRIMNQIAYLVDKANQYIHHNTPWNLKKDRRDTVLYVLLEMIRCITLYLQPFMPQTTRKILTILGFSKTRYLLKNIDNWLEPGVAIQKSEPIFTRIE